MLIPVLALVGFFYPDIWVKGKIDEGDFGNKVLKYETDGEKEIELSEMSAHLSM